jgi:ADP-ribose pyrophosphatase YjhB (NUDIX family)
MHRDLRVAAYAVCVRDAQVLLTRLVSTTDADRRWTLPGGGMEHGEDPYRTVVREVDEETGYRIEPVALLGVNSLLRPPRRRLTRIRGGLHHCVRIVYEGRITGGALRHETAGSTDLAAWHPLAAVPELDRVSLVDVGLTLWRRRPADGHVPSAPDPADGQAPSEPGPAGRTGPGAGIP